jgi:acyl carrier protein
MTPMLTDILDLLRIRSGNENVTPVTSLSKPLLDHGLDFDDLDYLGFVLDLETDFNIEIPDDADLGDTAMEVEAYIIKLTSPDPEV